MKFVMHNTQQIIFKIRKSFAKQCYFLSRDKQGFSLVEVMVVMSVVVIGLLGIASLSTQNIQAQNLNDQELVASMLAQEGIELVRNIRDRNWITESDPTQWKKDIDFPADFTLDYNDNVPDHTITIPLNNAEYASTELYIKDGFYSYDNTGTPSGFHRYLVTESMTETSDINDAIKVTCYVKWRSAGRDQSYNIEAHLYHWR